MPAFCGDNAPAFPCHARTHLPGPSSPPPPPIPSLTARAGVPTSGPITAAEAGLGQEKERGPGVIADLLCARRGC